MLAALFSSNCVSPLSRSQSPKQSIYSHSSPPPHTYSPTYTSTTFMHAASLCPCKHTFMQTHSEYRDYFYPRTRVMQIMMQETVTLGLTHNAVITWQRSPRMHVTHRGIYWDKNIVLNLKGIVRRLRLCITHTFLLCY